MGVRGLTTYIAENADRYFEPYELHDCKLVIDGDSLSSQLYKSSSECNSAFGGDYDQYYRHICNFFKMLQQCSVEPYVLLDGGYQPKKLNTVKHRLRSKIGAMKHLNPFKCPTMFPLMMREVFIEALQHCGVQYMRCLFEADDEVAALARKLNCPVLSYDSDFYIHNVVYIPSVSLVMKVFRRNIQAEGNGKSRLRKDLIAEIDADGNMTKFKAHKVALDAVATEKTFYYYIQCTVYRIEHLARNYQIRSQMLPLFAILLGNDYINSSMFRKFYMNVKVKKIGRNYSQQGKRIVALLRWLQHETLESAIKKILGHIEKSKKEWIRQQIDLGIDGYRHEKSAAYEYFGLAQQHNQLEDNSIRHGNYLEMLENDSSAESVEGSDEDTDEDDDAEGSEEFDDDEDEDVEEGDAEEFDEDDAEEVEEGDAEEIDEDGAEEVDEDGAEEVDEDDVEERDDEVAEGHDEAGVVDSKTPGVRTFEAHIKGFTAPDWLQQKMVGGKLPRFVMDLLTLRLYVNAPQVENFLLPDCNHIAMPILRLIFTILHYPKKNEFRYLTRVQRRTDIMFEHHQSLDIDIAFDVNSASNFDVFRLFLSEFENADDILASIDETVPSNLRLFFIAIIYWSKKSKHFNVIYACSLLLCQIVLTTIDGKLEPIRDQIKFNKIYNSSKSKKSTKNESLSQGDIEYYLQNVTKDECIAAQTNLLDLFLLHNKLRRKHTEFTSDILHGFAEFQSIVFHMNCLNVLCGEKYANIEMSKCYNGCFLFNAYNNLKDRPNVQYYIENFMLPANSMLLGLFRSMFHVLETFIASLSKVTISKRKKNRNIKKKLIRQQRKLAATEENNDENEENEQPVESEDEFEDINNRFTRLLKI